MKYVKFKLNAYTVSAILQEISKVMEDDGITLEITEDYLRLTEDISSMNGMVITITTEGSARALANIIELIKKIIEENEKNV